MGMLLYMEDLKRKEAEAKAKAEEAEEIPFTEPLVEEEPTKAPVRRGRKTTK